MKKELAKKCFDCIKTLGLNVEIKNNFIVLSPPNAVPINLSYYEMFR